MLSTNGHDPKRAILYARVSTDEQARSGYSLAQQMEALREYAAREGYEVLEEVQSPARAARAWSGREWTGYVTSWPPAGYRWYWPRIGTASPVSQLTITFYERVRGARYKIRALNDRGDDSPEGELTDGILDQLAKFERAKTAERARRGKLRKAREGKVMANNSTDLSALRYNATRDGYEVNEATMPTVGVSFAWLAGRFGPPRGQAVLRERGAANPGERSSGTAVLYHEE